MKNQVLFAVVVASLGITSAPAIASQAGPSPEVIRQVQNAEGCLDVEKAYQFALASGDIMAGIRDLRIVDDDQPVSEAFIMSLFTYLEIGFHWNRNNWLGKAFREQQGCRAFRMERSDSFGEIDIRLLEATPTRLTLEKFVRRNDEDFPDGITQMTIELASDQELRVNFRAAVSIQHALSCNVLEKHPVEYRTSLLWGKQPSIPAPEASLLALEKRASSDFDPAQRDHQRELEQAYCQAAQSGH